MPSAEYETALVRKSTRDQPQMKISGSLARAERDEFVYIGRRGEVRSPARYKAQKMAGMTIAGVAALFGVGMSFSLGIPWLSLLYIGLLGYGIHAWRLSGQLKQGAALLAADRLEEAEALLMPLAHNRFASRGVRALAWQNLAGIEVRKGRHACALERVRRCGELFRQHWRPSVGPWPWINRFSELQLLVQLGRLEEAEEIATIIKHAPDGEYFQALHMNAALALAFAHDDVDRLPDDLHPWIRVALETTTAELALTLLGWALERRGDVDMAEHLLDQALERLDPPLFRSFYPNVYAWLVKRRPDLLTQERVDHFDTRPATSDGCL